MLDNKASDIQLARQWYGKTKNTTGTLLITHALEAAEIMSETIKKTDELPAAVEETLYRATLGHDLLEDTPTTPSTIIESWGLTTFKIIQELTNTKGDRDFSDYLASLERASEEVLLVKFADILANLNNTHARLATIDPVWIRNFWLPLLHQYQRRLLSLPFRKYPLAAAYIKDQLTTSIHLLEKNLKLRR